MKDSDITEELFLINSIMHILKNYHRLMVSQRIKAEVKHSKKHRKKRAK